MTLSKNVATLSILSMREIQPMAPPTTKAIEVARQFRKAIALDLVTQSAQDAYDLMKLTVKTALDGIKNNPSYITNRQQIDAAKTLLSMSGVLEPRSDSDEREMNKLSLAELEKMIADLKVVEHSAAPDAATSAQVSEMLS